MTDDAAALGAGARSYEAVTSVVPTRSQVLVRLTTFKPNKQMFYCLGL